MAKKSKIAKYQKQQALIGNVTLKNDYELKASWRYWLKGLRKLPLKMQTRTVSTFRDGNRWSPRGVMRKFGMSRIKFRELAHQGIDSRCTKTSW